MTGRKQLAAFAGIAAALVLSGAVLALLSPNPLEAAIGRLRVGMTAAEARDAFKEFGPPQSPGDGAVSGDGVPLSRVYSWSDGPATVRVYIKANNTVLLFSYSEPPRLGCGSKSSSDWPNARQ